MSYFKTFDAEFPQNTFLPSEDRDAILEAAGATIKWEHEYFQPSAQRVQEAVYNVPSHREWQRFRVSLKGMSTRVKIARLDARWRKNIATRSSDDPEFALETVRIHNYIGALKRGGLLNDNLEIVA